MANCADPDQLASEKPTDLDLHCLQRQGISGFSMTRVKVITVSPFHILNQNLNMPISLPSYTSKNSGSMVCGACIHLSIKTFRNNEHIKEQICRLGFIKTHCILNRLSHTTCIYWKSPILI